MPTATEEQQAKDFLKRAEIRTMKKDLRFLREGDAVKERDKIARLKTLEEQLAEQEQANQASNLATTEKLARQEVLEKHGQEEKIAEKDLKNYATEQERQQIFLLESQKLQFEKQVDAIDKEKDPALKLEKNKLLIEIKNWQDKLNKIQEQEKQFEGEEKLLIDKEQVATSPAEKKSLEDSKRDYDAKIQDVEKKRWAVEKEIENINGKVAHIDQSFELLVKDKNDLRDKILGAEKSLRDIYSVVILREEDKRRGALQEQRQQQEAVAQAKLERNEQVRRQQWSQNPQMPEIPLPPVPAKRQKMAESFQKEEEQRKEFLKNVQENLK